MDEVKLLPCRECGSPCSVQEFPANAHRTASTLWLCSKNKELGGDCPLEWAFLTPEAWNRGSIHGLSPRPTDRDPAALIHEMSDLLFDSLYHLRVDEAAKAYHEKVVALRAKAFQP